MAMEFDNRNITAQQRCTRQPPVIRVFTFLDSITPVPPKNIVPVKPKSKESAAIRRSAIHPRCDNNRGADCAFVSAQTRIDTERRMAADWILPRLLFLSGEHFVVDGYNAAEPRCYKGGGNCVTEVGFNIRPIKTILFNGF